MKRLVLLFCVLISFSLFGCAKAAAQQESNSFIPPGVLTKTAKLNIPDMPFVGGLWACKTVGEVRAYAAKYPEVFDLYEVEDDDGTFNWNFPDEFMPYGGVFYEPEGDWFRTLGYSIYADTEMECISALLVLLAPAIRFKLGDISELEMLDVVKQALNDAVNTDKFVIVGPKYSPFPTAFIDASIRYLKDRPGYVILIYYAIVG
jgi:hypothetical protein